MTGGAPRLGRVGEAFQGPAPRDVHVDDDEMGSPAGSSVEGSQPFVQREWCSGRD